MSVRPVASRASARAMSGASLHALLGAIVTSCFAVQCGGRTDEAESDITPGRNENEAGASTPSDATPASPICEDDAPRLVDGLNPVEPVDYLAHYRIREDAVPPILIDEEGERPEACSSDTDTSTCEPPMPPTAGFDKTIQLPAYEYLAYRRGETVEYILDHSDPEVQRTFESIARDEAEHAALSLSIAEWLDHRLSPAERRQVHAERERAYAELESELRTEPGASIADIVGVPSAVRATALLRAVELAVFSSDDAPIAA